MDGASEKNSDKLPFLYIIAFFLYAAIALCANELNLGYNGVYLTQDYLYYCYGSTIVSLILGIALIILFTKKLGMKHSPFFLIAVVISFVCDVIALATFPLKLEIDESFYYLSPWPFRIYLILSYLSLSIFIYVLYAFMPLLKRGKNSFSFVFETIIGISLIAIFVSYFTDFEDYVTLFTFDHSKESFISSFLGHKNIFGLLLIFGLMSEIYLFELDKRKWRIAPAIYILVSTFLINSKSSLLAELALILSYSLYKGITLFKSRKGISIALLSIVGVCLVAGLVILSLPVPSKDGLLKTFILACKSVFNNGEGTTIGTRLAIYKKLFVQLNMSPMYWIFGFGDTNFQYSFFYAADSSSPDASPFHSWHAHNGFLECIGRGGIIRLAIYVSVLIYLGYRFVKKFKKEKDPSIFMSLVFFAPFLVRTMVEYEYLFLDGWKGAIFALFIITPILEGENEYEYSYSFSSLFRFLRGNYQFAFALIGSSLLSYSLASLNIYSLSICLPIGLVLLGLFTYLELKKDKKLTIWVTSFSLLLNLSISLVLGLLGNMPTLGIIFSFPFGLALPIVGIILHEVSSLFCKGIFQTR